MSEIPTELKYASSHEWARLEEDGTVTVGISDHAQQALGDVVYVEHPEAGQTVSAGSEAGVVESVKAASDIYAPVSGTITEVNEALEDAPEDATPAAPQLPRSAAKLWRMLRRLRQQGFTAFVE